MSWGLKCARTVPLLMPRQPAVQRLHVTHTYRLLTRELSLPAPQFVCAEACAARAQEHSTSTKKHSSWPRTHARMRGFKSPQSTVESRGGHFSRGNHEIDEHDSVQFGTSDRNRAMDDLVPRTSVHRKTGRPRSDPSRWLEIETVGGSLQHAHHDGHHEHDA